jgi:UPF0755 protein
VANRLEQGGFVRDAGAFLLLARLTGRDTGMQAGVHRLTAEMSADEVLTALQTAYEPGITVTIPEGWRIGEVAAFLESADVVAAEDFLRVAHDPATGRESGVVASRPESADLEGYLFPDTYEFDPEADATAAVARFIENFATRYGAEVEEAAAETGLSHHELVTLASIVEREAVIADERGPVARVFLNRLGEPPRLLDADPTVQFGLGYQLDINSWWKRPLTAEDLASASPYNTYVNPGLPPGPIASPGIAAMSAVAAAPPGDWMFFVIDGEACDGTHRFASDFDTHVANVNDYRASGCER